MRDTAFSFAASVEHEIESLSSEDFHLRHGRAKLLLEEWYPLSRLGLHLKQPGLEVVVEGFDDKRLADGHIDETGFRARSFDVQITCVEDRDRALRRELMQKQGYSPGAGPIERDKKSRSIKATMAAVDHDHNLKQAAMGIAKRFASKAEKGYPEGTVLLISFDDMTLQGFGMWKQLLELVKIDVRPGSGSFAGVYLVNTATNELVKAA